MSWQSWVDNLLQYEGVNMCAICGIDGSVWAKSPNFNASAQELQALIAGMQKGSAGEFTKFMINNEKYVTIRLDKDTREIVAREGQRNLTAIATRQAVVIGACIEDSQAGGDQQLAVQGGGQKVNLAVAKIADALSQSGY